MQAISLALKGSNRRDKLEAVDALESFGSADDPEIIRLLGEALADSDKAVKKSAIEALADKEGAAVIAASRRRTKRSRPFNPCRGSRCPE